MDNYMRGKMGLPPNPEGRDASYLMGEREAQVTRSQPQPSYQPTSGGGVSFGGDFLSCDYLEDYYDSLSDLWDPYEMRSLALLYRAPLNVLGTFVHIVFLFFPVLQLGTGVATFSLIVAVGAHFFSTLLAHFLMEMLNNGWDLQLRHDSPLWDFSGLIISLIPVAYLAFRLGFFGALLLFLRFLLLLVLIFALSCGPLFGACWYGPDALEYVISKIPMSEARYAIYTIGALVGATVFYVSCRLTGRVVQSLA